MNFTANDVIYTVGTLTRELKNLVENKYRFVKVQGEISSLKRPFSGHSYFTLKDESAQLKSVLFKGSARYLEQDIADGQQVVCHGRLSIYEPRGDYQLIVDSVDFQGAGLLQQRFEQLKNKLAQEGLFSAERKKQLPKFPREIVIITSPSGAAVHDFLKIWRHRAFPTNITIFPARVQGAEAASEIATALMTANREYPKSDLVVLCRGGGSLEDLWPFNEEVLARAIARSQLPIVSAIGHEVDFTISDFCADMRAATPTAAAEAIIPDIVNLKAQMQRLVTVLTGSVTTLIENNQYRVDQNKRLLGDLDFLFANGSLRLDHATTRLRNGMAKRLEKEHNRCNALASRLQNNSPITRLSLQQQRLNFVAEKLHVHLHRSLNDWQAKLGRHAALLDAVSPLATLARGYSISSKIDPANGKRSVVRGSDELQRGDQIEVRLHKGKVECEVSKVLLHSK
jgi:exodeoxyribonuclease VII large subunit